MKTRFPRIVYAIVGLLLLGAIAADAHAQENDEEGSFADGILLPSEAQENEKPPAVRTWTSADGTSHTEAALLDFRYGKVWLEIKGGKIVPLRMEQLSQADQQYVKQHLGRRKAEDDADVGIADDETEVDRATEELCKQIVDSSRGAAGKKPKVAVVEFGDLSGRVTDLGRSLSEELITKLFRTGKYDVVERLLLNKILAEHQLKVEGFVDPKTAKELGQILGVDAIVSGTIADRGNSLRVNARVISSESGEVLSVAAVTMDKDESVLALMGRGDYVQPPHRVAGPGNGKTTWREDFSKYDVGDQPWGPKVFLKKFSDGRKALVTSVEGAHTVGPDVTLPESFRLEFDFFAQVADKYLGGNESLPTHIYFLDKEGTKLFDIIWDIESNGYYLQFPNGAHRRSGDTKTKTLKHSDRWLRSRPYWQHAGTVRVDRTRGLIKVFINGDLLLSADASDLGRFDTFQVDVYEHGEVSDTTVPEYIAFTDFRISASQ